MHDTINNLYKEVSMTVAKIEFTIGSISFSAEGEENWLSDQLDKIIDKAPNLIKIAPIPQTISDASAEVVSPSLTKSNAAITAQTLPNFLKEKGANKGQAQKFLATSIWLQAKGKSRLMTGEVTKALKDSNQSRLGNPSDALAKNITEGYIERDGKEFFVTSEGEAV